jgi:hypothetical protein
MNRSQTRPEIGEGGFETGSWAFRCRHPLFPLVRGVRREHLGEANRNVVCRVTPGRFRPEVPTDPDVQNSRIRLLASWIR